MSTVLSLVTIIAVVCLLPYGDAWFLKKRGGGGGSSHGSTARRPHDIGSQSGLTSLYNQRVTHVDQVRRPLGSGTFMAGPISHSGVVVTTDTGKRWLIHKGDGYGGRGGETVVTDASHMSRRWRNFGGHDVSRSTVGDFVRAGGTDYSLTGDNCHNGRNRMLGLP